MITFLLFTHRNPEHLNRALVFYKKLMPDAKIVVADSNFEEDKKRSRRYVQAITSQNYVPLHLEYDAYIPFSEKVALGIKFVSTPYCILLADDDFFSPQSIFEAMRFLERSPEYNFVYGHQYGFTFDSSKDELKWYCSGYYENIRSFFQDDPLERLDSYLRRYTTTIYSVFRTNVVKQVVAYAALYGPNLVFFDNMFTMQILMMGKGYSLEKPFVFKEMSNSSASVMYNAQWFLGKDFEKNKKLMEKGLEQGLVDRSLLVSDVAKKRSVKSINLFMETTFYTMYPMCVSQSFLRKQIDKLKRFLPKILKIKLSLLISFLKRENFDIGQNYLFDKTSPYSWEFEEINFAIKKSGITAMRDGFEDFRQL